MKLPIITHFGDIVPAFKNWPRGQLQCAISQEPLLRFGCCKNWLVQNFQGYKMSEHGHLAQRELWEIRVQSCVVIM